jgi:putative membrane protein insertion efficiency factor
MRTFVVGCIRFYQLLISPLLPTSCRFYPTCSVYSQEAIERYGVGKGLRLTLRRLARCHPGCKGGYDPVP